MKYYLHDMAAFLQNLCSIVASEGSSGVPLQVKGQHSQVRDLRMGNNLTLELDTAYVDLVPKESPATAKHQHTTHSMQLTFH